MEIERKYLVASLPEDLDSYPHVEIEQGYLCTSPTVRIRRMGDAHILTVKENLPPSPLSERGAQRAGCALPGRGAQAPVELRQRPPAIHNREEEFTLSSEAYTRLRSKCEGRMVAKTRYRVPLPSHPGLTAELDIFHGFHEGMTLVEVEFPDTATANAFVPPDWFGMDVSNDPRYRNSYLALK
jgi:CYTH domain-containing protein